MVVLGIYFHSHLHNNDFCFLPFNFCTIKNTHAIGLDSNSSLPVRLPAWYVIRKQDTGKLNFPKVFTI